VCLCVCICVDVYVCLVCSMFVHVHMCVCTSPSITIHASPLVLWVCTSANVNALLMLLLHEKIDRWADVLGQLLQIAIVLGPSPEIQRCMK
jgi:hypothetical protein